MSSHQQIGYLVPEFPTQTHIFFWREIQAFRSLGYELKLLSTRRPQQDSRHQFVQAAKQETIYLYPPKLGNALIYLINYPGHLLKMLSYILKVEDTPWKSKLRLLGLIFFASNLVTICREHKIGHVHGHSCADVGHLLALCSLSGQISFSLTLHGDLPVYGTGHKLKFSHAKFVAVVTKALQDQVHEFCKLPRSNLPVIRMGVDIERFQPAKSSQSRLQLITVARLAECKGHIHALQAIRELKAIGVNVFYRIVGEGEQRASIEQCIKDWQLEDSVHLTGTASEDEVLAFLQQSDIFILPSVGLGEAAPVSVMESMACGLTVISSIIGGTPEMIVNGIDGFLVNQGDHEEIARLIKRLAAEPDLAKKLGEQARKTAELKFSALSSAKQLADQILA